MSSVTTGRNRVLGPQGLHELATREVVIRAWSKGEILNIDLVARGSRINPPPPLICVHHEAKLPSPFREQSRLFLGPPSMTLSLDRHRSLEQEILNSWREYTPDLCRGLSAFACHILQNGSTIEMPVGHLLLIPHYIRLRTLLEVSLEAKHTFGDNLSMLLDRFGSFIQQQLKELERLGNMLSKY